MLRGEGRGGRAGRKKGHGGGEALVRRTVDLQVLRRQGPARVDRHLQTIDILIFVRFCNVFVNFLSEFQSYRNSMTSFKHCDLNITILKIIEIILM